MNVLYNNRIMMELMLNFFGHYLMLPVGSSFHTAQFSRYTECLKILLTQKCLSFDS
jgi:hypothetical protein